MSLMQEISSPAPRPVAGGARRLRVGYLSPHNPHDRTAFSGTAHHMVQALAARDDITLSILGGHRPVGRAHRVWRRFVAQRDIDPRQIDFSGLDLVIGLAATDLIDRIPQTVRTPIIHVTDATPSFLRDVYGWTVPPSADVAEQRVVARAALNVYSSLYMARRAADEFGKVARDAVFVPFGTNLDAPPTVAPTKSGAGPARLLWVGRQWDRKGGPLAVAMLDILRAQGLDARLTLVGDVPPAAKDHPGVTAIGSLDRNRAADASRLSELYAQAHLFVLPTRADCTPMVIAEANAHGTPVLVTDVGGIGSLVVPGRNGHMLPLDADAAAWAQAAAALLCDPEDHAQMCRASFAHAHQRLSWSAWAQDTLAFATSPRVLAA